MTLFKYYFQVNQLFFIFIIFFCILGAMHQFLTYFFLIFLMVLITLFARRMVFAPSVTVCKGLLLLIVFQNLSIGLGAHLSNNDDSSLSLLTQIPFCFIFIQWGMLFIYNKTQLTNRKKLIVFSLLLVSIIVSINNGLNSLSSALLSTRNLIAFFLIYDIGYYNVRSRNELSELTVFVIRLSIFLLLIGVVLLIGGYPLYELFGIREVYIAKGSPLQGNALDDRFTTSILNSIEHNRMGSTFYEPVSLGYFFSCAFLVTCFVNWTTNYIKKTIASVIVLIGLILTFGKGGYMVTIFSSFFFFVDNFFVKKKLYARKIIRTITILSLILLVSLVSIFYYKNVATYTVAPHFEGIIQTFYSVIEDPLGHGIGNGGNAALIYGIKTPSLWLSSGGETQLMSFIYQIGIHGGIFFVLCVLSTMLPLDTISHKGEQIFIVLPAILLGMSLLQDNTFTVQCITLFMIFQGSVNRQYDQEKSFI